jgi:hypothetical protein
MKAGTYTDYVRLLPPNPFVTNVFAQLFVTPVSEELQSMKAALLAMAAQLEAAASTEG